MKIALDVLGGDDAPFSNIEGAYDYIDECGQSAADIVMLGDRDLIHTTIYDLSKDAYYYISNTGQQQATITYN